MQSVDVACPSYAVAVEQCVQRSGEQHVSQHASPHCMCHASNKRGAAQRVSAKRLTRTCRNLHAIVQHARSKLLAWYLRNGEGVLGYRWGARTAPSHHHATKQEPRLAREHKGKDTPTVKGDRLACWVYVRVAT